MKFSSFKSWLNEAAYNSDMMVEFGYFNQFLSKPLSASQFKKLVEQSKVQKMSLKLFLK